MGEKIYVQEWTDKIGWFIHKQYVESNRLSIMNINCGSLKMKALTGAFGHKSKLKLNFPGVPVF